MIEDVNVIDVRSGRTTEHVNVGIAGSRIVGVSPGKVEAASTAVRINGRGLYLLPGLWDMHAHALWSVEAVETFLPAYVANGVTGIRDMGGEPGILRAVRDSVHLTNARVPRVVGAGPMIDGPQPIDPSISIAVADSAGARQVVDSLVNAGVDLLKVYTLLPRDAYYAMIAEARRAGLPVVGHIPAEVTPQEAAEAGQKSIEHLNDELEPYCTPAAPMRCAAIFEAFRRNRTWQVPTLIALRMKAFMDDAGVAADPRLQYIPTGLRTSWLSQRAQKMTRGPEYFAGKRERFRGELWLTAQLWQDSVPLLAGSDAGVAFSFPGFSLHDELALLVEAGISPRAALYAATAGATEFLASSDSLGTVEAGKVADLLLLRSNPLQDIRHTRAIETVILRGQIIDRKELDNLLAAVAVAAGR